MIIESNEKEKQKKDLCSTVSLMYYKIVILLLVYKYLKRFLSVSGSLYAALLRLLIGNVGFQIFNSLRSAWYIFVQLWLFPMGLKGHSAG